ncbi:MAG: amidohydrolase [Gammaproteobacteria bacterium]|nr:amidohydrolase [Gammaproteobacteria bacterium]MDH4254112.1 amidohydrolase [Gammaproteobacteria bacterium]MDH5309060.1 amidohydrolase [Gammaproteobacteria bacterium]
MGGFSRRKFIGASAVAPLGLGFGASRPASADDPFDNIDMIVTGARILTMDTGRPVEQALAVRGDRIFAVGRDEDILPLAGSSTIRIDGRGLTVTPGFIDSHSHPLFAEEAVGANVNLPRISDVQEALARKAARTPPGHWVRGVMYDDTIFEEERPLNRRDIDEAVPDHPVFVGHRGGHTAVVNSKAFEIAGVSIDTPDPVGGKFYREDGELTGKVAEHAMDVFRDVGTWPVMDRKVRQEAVQISSRNMAAAGLTSTTDAYGNYDDFVAYQDARDAGEMLFRLSFMPGGNSEVYAGFKQAGLRSGFGDSMLRIGAVKFAADGSASERTMSMSTPYAGRPSDFGILTMTQDQVYEAVEDAVAHGFRVGIHANGDVAIDMVLNAYERALKGHDGPNPRHRIEHCSLVNPDLLRRIRAAGVVPAPFYTYAHYHGNKWVEYGEDKMESMFAHRSFLDAGIPVAPASDYTPGPYEPMMAIQSMVTRKDMRGRVWGPSQRVTVTEALRICTVHGAYASFEENVKGSIEAGKLADFVVLEKDPHDVDPDDIVNIKVLRTVMGGRTTYEA